MNTKNRMIYKYKVPIEIAIIIKMPKDAKILTLKLQNDKPYIWVEFDAENENNLEERTFFIAMTGQEFGCYMKYIDTFFQNEIVCHLYERVLE